SLTMNCDNRNIARAVPPAGREPARPVGRLAAAALERYPVFGRAVPTLISLSENAVFKIDDPVSGEAAILRIHRPGYHDRAAIAPGLQWAAALRREAGLATPEPIAARDGSLIQALPCGRLAVLFKYLTGSEPPEDAWPAHFVRLGEISARMHAHARA